MSNYECGYCEGISTESEWDKATGEKVGTDIMGIREGKKNTQYKCSYACPKCGKYQLYTGVKEI